jgi:hypothetical protein
MNPIEPVRTDLKKRIRAHRPHPLTFKELKSIVLAKWENLPMEDINKHTGRMRECVQVLLEAKGGHTNF